MTRADWDAQRQAFLADPGAFFGSIARSTLHWYHPEHEAWLTWDEAQGR
ncbi:hypothetical protein [Archangium sp.]|nr:hypothetical protein [Archangium sp.]HYO52163.1 hypothetical protein [Archangium sp.]